MWSLLIWKERERETFEKKISWKHKGVWILLPCLVSQGEGWLYSFIWGKRNSSSKLPVNETFHISSVLFPFWLLIIWSTFNIFITHVIHLLGNETFSWTLLSWLEPCLEAIWCNFVCVSQATFTLWFAHQLPFKKLFLFPPYCVASEWCISTLPCSQFPIVSLAKCL